MSAVTLGASHTRDGNSLPAKCLSNYHCPPKRQQQVQNTQISAFPTTDLRKIPYPEGMSRKKWFFQVALSVIDKNVPQRLPYILSIHGKSASGMTVATREKIREISM
jgi:hypothetical protein